MSLNPGAKAHSVGLNNEALRSSGPLQPPDALPLHDVPATEALFPVFIDKLLYWLQILQCVIDFGPTYVALGADIAENPICSLVFASQRLRF